MARVKRAVNAHKKRRTTLELASGYRGQRSRLYRKAKEQVLHSLNYAYRDRRARKGDFRQLWITRINAAARANGMTYNRFVQGLKAAGVEVDRKVLADIAVTDEAAFAALVEVAKANLPTKESSGAIGSLTTQVEPPRTERSARVVAARKLLRRAGRDRAGRFLVEGAQAVREALAARGGCASCSSPTPPPARHPDLLGTGARVRITERAAESLSDTVTPQGIFAVCDLLDVPLDRRARGCAAARRRVRGGGRSRQRGHGRAGGRRGGRRRRGARGDTVDPHNGKAVRASTGSLFHLPIARERDAATVLDACRAAGLATLVADAPRRARPARPGGRTGARRARRLDIRWRGARRPGDRCRTEPTTACGCRSTAGPRA